LDRHIERMMVQCTDDIYEGPRNSTWRRTFVRNMAPWAIRIANWPMNTTPIDSKYWSSEDWVWIVVKWPVSCFLLIFTVSSSCRLGREFVADSIWLPAAQTRTSLRRSVALFKVHGLPLPILGLS
jgi:hypothetical protein